MTDVLTPAQRKLNMSRIKASGNKSTEQRMVALMRREDIHGWRRNYNLPGRPDFVFRQERVAVFVDGCFWHGCPKCFRMPTSNVEYWQSKIERNRARDRIVNRELVAKHWRVLRVWEHSLKEPAQVAWRLRRALGWKTIKPESSAEGQVR